MTRNSQSNLFKVLLLLAFVPFAWIAFYCHPSADDFAYAWSSKYLGILSSCKRDYLNWNGRYFSNLLVFCNPISFNSFWAYKLVPLLLLITSFFSLNLLINELFQESSIGKLHTFYTAILLLIILIHLPQLAQGIYWYTGAITYQLAIILQCLYFTHLLRFFKKKYWLNHRLDLLLLLVQAAVIIGFNETAMVQLVLLHSILAIYMKNKNSLLLIMVVFVCSLMVVLAPGNEGRSAQFENNHQFVHSLVYSVLQTARFSVSWIGSLSLFTASLLSLPILYQFNRSSPAHAILKIKPIQYLILLGILIFASVFPAYWAMGMLAQHRTVNVACFYFIPLWFLFLSSWLQHSQNEWSKRLLQFVVKYRTALLVVFIASSCLQGNLYLVSKDLLTGTASSYSTEMEMRYVHINRCKAENVSCCAVDSLKNKPLSIFNFDLDKNPEYWINKGEAAYFGITKINTK
ncbi:MAG TPA: hypothetical protein PLI68_04665 [Bacteroidia bacterium]|nr:hypothetical protein [Bacteroidia bacterium]